MDIYNLIFVVEIIVQMNLLSKFRKTREGKYFNIFKGFVTAQFILIGLMYFYVLFGGVRGLNEALIQLLIMGVFLVANILLVLKSSALKKQINVISDKKYICKLVVIIIFVSIGIPIVNMVLINTLVANRTIDYLNTKYGDNDFKVVLVSKDYTDNGLVISTHTGYKINVTSPMVDREFVVYAYGTSPGTIREFSEHSFIVNYYEKEINEYLGNKYDYTVYLSLEEDNISKKLGHIPTFDDLVAFKAISTLSFTARDYNTYCLNGTVNCVLDLTMYLAKYFKISGNNVLEFSIFVNKNTEYDVRLMENTLEIIKDGKVYEWNISSLYN